MSFAVERAQGHDDFLVSLALTVEAASHAAPRRATARLPGGDGWLLRPSSVSLALSPISGSAGEG
jgi:hypothetical protein